MKTFIIFDNGGKSFDRFTIINKETGEVFGASENPNAPNGIGKFFGNCSDHLIVMYGAGWRQKHPIKKVIKAEVENYINNAKLDPTWIGSEVDFKSLPENVQKYISGLGTQRPAGNYSMGQIAHMLRASEDPISSSGIH